MIVPLSFYWQQNFNYKFLILHYLLATSSFIISFIFLFLFFNFDGIRAVCKAPVKSHKAAKQKEDFVCLLALQKLRLLLQLSLGLYLSALGLLYVCNPFILICLFVFTYNILLNFIFIQFVDLCLLFDY